MLEFYSIKVRPSRLLLSLTFLTYSFLRHHFIVDSTYIFLEFFSLFNSLSGHILSSANIFSNSTHAHLLGTLFQFVPCFVLLLYHSTSFYCTSFHFISFHHVTFNPHLFYTIALYYSPIHAIWFDSFLWNFIFLKYFYPISLIDFHPAYGKGILLLSPCSGHGFKVRVNQIEYILLIAVKSFMTCRWTIFFSLCDMISIICCHDNYNSKTIITLNATFLV